MKKEVKQAKIACINSTTNKDNTYWVTYKTGKNHGYEIVKGDVIKSYKIGSTITVNKKQNLSICGKMLFALIMNCHISNNEMWLVEKGEITDAEVLKIQDEVLTLDKEYTDLKLSEYVTFGEDDSLITIYGGVSTLFEFRL